MIDEKKIEHDREIRSALYDMFKRKSDLEKREQEVLLYRLRQITGGKNIVIKSCDPLTKPDIIIKLI